MSEIAAEKKPAAKKPAARKSASPKTSPAKTSAAKSSAAKSSAAKSSAAKSSAAKKTAASAKKPAARAATTKTAAARKSATAAKSPKAKATAVRRSTAKAKAGPKAAARNAAERPAHKQGNASALKHGTSAEGTARPASFHMTPAQIEQFGEEMEALRNRTLADLGQRDVDYIKSILNAQRRFELTGRGLLFFGFLPPAWLAGTVSLGIAKILDNMEIGHNVMHGQYDWTQDPRLSSKNFEWDTAAPSANWKQSHNVTHHTYTNIVGKDRDVGYGILRMSEDQPWHPYYLGNTLWAFLLMVFFEYGVALHDLEVERIASGEITFKEQREVMDKIWRKVGKQAVKDYLLFPAMTGPLFPLTLASNFSSNIIRNVWAFMIIFCGHFPDGIEEFAMEETENETRGEWYYRQVLGSGNLTGGKLFHIMSGNLSHQIEHHLFPDIPAHRYAEMSIEVQEACARYGIPYNTGPLHQQFGTVVRRIFKLSFPDNFPLPSLGMPKLPATRSLRPSMPDLGLPSMPKVSMPSLPNVGLPSVGLPSLPKPSLSAIGL